MALLKRDYVFGYDHHDFVKPPINALFDELRCKRCGITQSEAIKLEPNPSKLICSVKSVKSVKSENDSINHPSHYTQGIECANYIESHKMDFFQGNAVKYLTRFRHKGTPLEDLKKAKWYVERLIQVEEKTETAPPFSHCEQPRAHGKLVQGE